MSAQRYYFFCIYTNRSLKESFLQKTKVHPKWLLIKKTLFERKGLQNPPIDKKNYQTEEKQRKI